MPRTIDYYVAVQSPWTYLGHARFCEIARAAGATVRLLPIDLGPVFAVSGGLPLGKRPAQRQAYRLVDLRRVSAHLQLPFNLQPRFFPVAGDNAARLVVTVDQRDGTQAALTLVGAVLAAVWKEERNIADDAVLAALLDEARLPAVRLEESRQAEVQQRYAAHTQQAIDQGIFGAPSYVLDGEIFWGQDRLDFLQRQLSIN